MKRHLSSVIVSFLYLCLIVTFFVPIKAKSQTSPLAHIKTSINSQHITRLSPIEGLSQSYATSVVQDELGYIWIGTLQGLNRYDGYQISAVDIADGIFLDAEIVNLALDQNNQLLVSTLENGLYRIDPESYQVTQIFDGLINDAAQFEEPVYTIKNAENNFLWLGIGNKLALLDSLTGNLDVLYDFANDNEIIIDLMVQDNLLLLATSKQLYRYDIRSRQIKTLSQFEGGNKIYRLMQENDTVYLATSSGVFTYTEGSFNQLSETATYDLLKTSDGFYFATQSGLVEFSLADSTLHAIFKPTESRFMAASDTLHTLYQDRSGAIWASSTNQGVFMWSTHTKVFTTLEKEALSDPTVTRILNIQGNTLLVGTEYGLNLVDLNTSQFEQLRINEQSLGHIYMLQRDEEEKDRVWIQADSSLYQYNIASKVLEKITLPDFTQRFFDTGLWGFTQLKNRDFIFASLKGFYVVSHKDFQVTPLISLNKQVPIEQTYLFLQSNSDNPNHILISTSKGLYRYNFATLEAELVLPIAKKIDSRLLYVDDFIADDRGNKWVSVPGLGVLKLDRRTHEVLAKFDVQNGLTTNSTYALSLDSNGHIWVSSQRGLMSINPNNHFVKTFTVKDGLPVDEFNSGAAAILENGVVALGTPRGLVLFDPNVAAQIKAPVFSPLLTHATLIGGKRLAVKDNHIQLEHDDFGLHLDFSSRNYAMGHHMQFDVAITGTKAMSFNNLEGRRLTLTQLSPGDYTITVTTTHALTGQTSAPIKLTLSVAFAPWQSPMAKFCYLLVTLLILGATYYRHYRHKKHLEKAHMAVLKSQQQTELALKSSRSGIWDYDILNDRVFDERLYKELGYQQPAERISMDEYAKYMHPDDVIALRELWIDYLKAPTNTWDHVYRMRHADGKWIWYRDIGQAQVDEFSGRLERITGTYSNITHTKQFEQRARILGEAFSQINDWLLILDEQFTPMSVNKSCLAFFTGDHTRTELTTDDIRRVLGVERLYQYRDTLLTLKPGQKTAYEETLSTHDGRQLPCLVSVNAVGSQNKVQYYVVVVSDLTTQKRAEEKLRYMANYDGLTGLANRSLMRETIDASLIKAREENHINALFFIDLDKFKPVNDTFGHPVGDKLLKLIAKRINNLIGDNAVLARQSGDEFLLLIENVQSPDAISYLAEQLSNKLVHEIKIDGFTINISASIGIALFPFDADNTEDLIRNADVAMIHAKNAGRNGFKFFTDEMNAKVTARLLLENALKQAEREDCLFNHYQPIMDMSRGGMTGVELLMRWHNNDEPVSPAEFIPVAEEVGLIESLTEQALKRALHELAPLFDKHADFYVSVNLSAIHILNSELTDQLLSILHQYQVKPSSIRLEITEGILLEDKSKAKVQLQKLKSAGFKLFLDDFGTGYSSLTYLNQFPIDVIKIDQSFVKHIGKDAVNESIIKTIVGLAHNLGIYCIAEGVETVEHQKVLSALGCCKHQGYLYARPMPAEDLLAFFEQRLLDEVHL